MRRESGVTLIEAILVLVIAAAILSLGVYQYNLYRTDAEITQVKYNIDSLFRAMGMYYQANCRENKDENGTVIKAGTLDPNHVPPPSSPFAIDIEHDLNALGYINPWPPLNNPIIDSYSAQFNRVSSVRSVYACYKNPDTGAISCSEPEPTVNTGQGNTEIWVAQVSVKLTEPEQAQTWQQLLGATCIAKASGTVVETCLESSGEGDYLVWEQLPSFGSPSLLSDLWLSSPRLKQMNSQYTNADLDALNSGSYWALPPTTYYLCGG